MALFRLKKGTAAFGTGKDRKVYNHADPRRNVVESDRNLAALDPDKFERVAAEWHDEDAPAPRGNQTSAPAPAQPAPATTAKELEERYGGPLDDMTAAELREIAAAEKIPLHGASTKAEIVKALKSGAGK
jgi:hypothetical protein